MRLVFPPHRPVVDPTSARSRVGTVVVMMLLSVLFGTVIAILPSPQESLLWARIALLILFAVSLLPMIWELRTGHFDPLNLKNLFVLYVLLQFGANAIAFLFFGEEDPLLLSSTTNSGAYAAVLGLAGLGILSFYIGYYARIGDAIARKLPEPAKWQVKRLRFIVPGIWLVAGLSLLLLFRGAGGVSAYLSNREWYRSVGLVGLGYLQYPATGLVQMVCLALLLVTSRKRVSGATELFSLALFGVSLIPAYLIGFRSMLVFPLLQLAAIWHYTRQRLGVLTVLMLVLLLVVGMVVYGASSRGLGAVPALSDLAGQSLGQVFLRSRGVDVTAVIVSDLAVTGDFQYGWRSLIEVVTVLLPRQVFPFKITPISIRFARTFFEDYFYRRDWIYSDTIGGVSPTVVGEFYWNFGLLGVLLGMGILGVLSRVVYKYMQRDPLDPSRMLLYCIFMVTLVLIQA